MHDSADPAAAADRFAALLDAFGQRRRSALARVISLVEDERPGFESLLHTLATRIGRAHRIGITGPPGAGKSTLLAGLIRAFRARGETIAVLAVDPTSPFTGGALLGDRIRMNDVGLDEGVFIRSMATRGSLGGLALSTGEVADVMDAYGFDRILVETVGVGQSELDVAGAADTTAVVLVPESGDSVQALKAGLMEIADLYVVNKADRAGAARLAQDIASMLHLRAPDPSSALRTLGSGHHGTAAAVSGPALVTPMPDARLPAASNPGPGAAPPPGGATADPGWTPPVLQTVASMDTGVAELAVQLEAHRVWAEARGELVRRRRARLQARVREAVARRLASELWQHRGGETMLRDALPALASGASTPYEVAARIVRDCVG